MRSSIQCFLCALAMMGCGSSAETPAPSATPAVPAPVAAVAPAAAAPAAAPPTPTEPAPGAAHIAGHFWRAQAWFPVPEGVDVSSPPEGVSLNVDQARHGTEEELAAPPLVEVYSELALDAPPPVALLTAYGGTIHAAAGEGCHLGVGLELSPITVDMPSRARYSLLQLCPLTELDHAVTNVTAWAPGEDLGLGETDGFFLSVEVGQPLAPFWSEAGGVAIDAPGVEYVLVQWGADPDAPGVVRFAVAPNDAGAAALASFAGGPIEIERP